MVMGACEYDFWFFPTTITQLLRLAGHNYTNFSTAGVPVNWCERHSFHQRNNVARKQTTHCGLGFWVMSGGFPQSGHTVVNHCCLPLTTCVQKRQLIKRFEETVIIKWLNREDFPILFAPMLLLLSLGLWELANTNPFLAQAACFREAPGISMFQEAPSDMGKKDLSSRHHWRMEYHRTFLTLFVPLLQLPLDLGHAFLSVLCKQKAVHAQVSLNISQHIAQSLCQCELGPTWLPHVLGEHLILPTHPHWQSKCCQFVIKEYLELPGNSGVTGSAKGDVLLHPPWCRPKGTTQLMCDSLQKILWGQGSPITEAEPLFVGL